MLRAAHLDRVELDRWVFAPHVAFERAIEAGYINNKGHPYSRVSHARYITHFADFCQYILERQLSILEIDNTEIAQFLELRGVAVLSSANSRSRVLHITPVPLHRARYLRYLSVLDSVMRLLVAKGLRDSNPVDTSLFLPSRNRADIPDTKPRLSLEEDAGIQQFLLSRLPAERWQTRRDVAMILFILGAGATASDVHNARFVDFEISDTCITFHGCNSDGSPKILKLDEFSVAPVQNWLEEAYSVIGGEFAFPTRGWRQFSSTNSIGEIVRETLKGKTLGGQSVTPTRLRKVWCQRQLLKGTDPKVLQRRLGLKSRGLIDRIRRTLPKGHRHRPIGRPGRHM
ncbi:integrase [Paraburkholderia sp. UCT70]|uniref:tyrosine-type recombinase/integrase n=1 Tax=Paraburkholderia sp. UCT70 TaxID=2991068 RepID=UPI003D1B939D